MADDDNEKQANDGGKKRIIIFAILALLIMALSVGGTYFALQLMAPEPAPEAADPAAMENAEPVKKDAIYYPLKPKIIVNFDVKGRQRFAQVDVTLMTRDEDVVSAVEIHNPMIRNALILIIGGQLYEDVLTAEGKELLRQQCLMELQKIMEQEIGKPGIEQVLFTNFVMQ